MEIKKIILYNLPLGILKCMVCGGTATLRTTIFWDDAGVDIHPILCNQCAKKPAEIIIKEVLNHG
jgi:hypothetical protein